MRRREPVAFKIIGRKPCIADARQYGPRILPPVGGGRRSRRQYEGVRKSALWIRVTWVLCGAEFVQGCDQRGQYARDLLVGKLYRYEERIALGTDPARFREEIPRWLDTGLRLVVEALRLRFPDTDFAPVEARARAELLPAVQAAIVNLHHAGTAMFLELGSLKADMSLAALARSEFWPAVTRELAAFGVRLPADEAGLRALEKDDGAGYRLLRDVQANLADRLLAPLPEAQRAPIREALIAEEGLERESELAREKVAPDADEFAAIVQYRNH